MKARSEPGERNRRRFENQVSRYIEEEALLPSGSRIVVGVSGGPDSTALLLILGRLSKMRSLELAAAYFDHRLWGREAANREQAVVAKLAAKAGVDLVCGDADVRHLAREGKLSLEDAARRARYEFLGRSALDAGAGFVAVGHTLDDQAETVLMHILRGAGLTGVAGMSPRSSLPVPGFAGVELVRPLLQVRRAETARYCRDSGLMPLEDDSNRSHAYLRNRVRLDLMPALAGYNNDAAGALARLAAAAREDLGFIESEGERLFADAGGVVGLDRNLLRSSHPALRRQAVRAAVVALLGDVQGFSERHWAALGRVARGPTGSHLDLPRSIVADVLPTLLRLRLREDVASTLAIQGALAFPVPGEGALGAWRFRAANEPLPGALMVAEVDAAAAGSVLTVRSRRTGDRFQPLGLSGTKKLKDYFTDAHVARGERDAIPIFEAAEGILWVAGHRIADRARPVAGRPTIVLSCAHQEAGP
jgi:tRNA(Ile)-lysidine synthase